MSNEQNTPQTSFVTNKDYEEFSKNGENLDVAIETFLDEIRDYFNEVWQDKYAIKEQVQSLDCLNKEHLLNYPSNGGDAILDDSFTGPECPVDILSPLSKTVLGYFYGIHLH
jgi:hypothetical protein